MIRQGSMFVIGLGLICLSGCLVNHSHHRVVRQAEPLQPITFESEGSRDAFEAFVESQSESKANRSSSSLAIPFLVSLSHSKSTSETAIRNDTAARLDVNGDRIISDYEVSLGF